MKLNLKKGWLILLCFLLMSCSAPKNEKQFYAGIEKALFSLSESDSIPQTNMEKKYYSYYLPFDVKRMSSTMLSEQFKCGNDTLVMNFRTISFIKKAYYNNIESEKIIVENYTEEELENMVDDSSQMDKRDIFEAEEQMVLEIDYEVKRTQQKKGVIFSGKYLANYGKNYNYVLSLRKDGNMCYMYLDGEIATFACYVPIAECEDMLYRMFYIMKSMEYDTTGIIKDYKLLYSLKQMEESFEEEWYEETIPDSGYLEDLIQRQED